MNLEDLQSEWAKDCKIDNTQIDTESKRVPELHSKYLNLLSTTRIRLKKQMEKKKLLEQRLMDYYEGKVDGPSIGREPFQLVVTKSGAEKRVETDPEIIKLNITIAETEEMTLFLKEVIGSINQRNWLLRSIIDWNRFTGGQL